MTYTDKNLSAAKDLLVRLVPHVEPFLYVVPMTVITEADWEKRCGKDQSPTACTNGDAMFFVDTFIGKLPLNKQMGLILHELLHMARGDLTYPWVDTTLTMASFRELANIAQDMVIEGWIAEIGKALRANTSSDRSTWAICPNHEEERYKKYIGWDWRAVYADLLQKAKDEGRVSPSGTVALGSNGGVDAPGSLNEGLQGDVDRAAEDSENIRGTLAGTIHQNVGGIKLQKAKATVAWQTVVRSCLTAVPAKVKRTWNTVNRRIFGATDVYAPGRNGTKLGFGEITLYIDTSGSMHDTLDRVGADIMKLINDFKPKILHLIYYDVAILHRTTVRGVALRGYKLTNMPGGGGTCVAGAMAEQTADKKHRPHPVIVMTDGYDNYNLPHNVAKAFTQIIWLSYSTPVHSLVGRSVVIPRV